jgi:hypothetical protein
MATSERARLRRGADELLREGTAPAHGIADDDPDVDLAAEVVGRLLT